MIQDLILDAKAQVQKIVEESNADSRTVIARYTAAMAVNFTDWIGKTIPWVRHETACHTLLDNLRCEATHDHVGMLLLFAKLSNALPSQEDYTHTAGEVAAIRHLFVNPIEAGLSGVTLCAVLENTSEIFIPDLARRAKERGCTDLSYTDVHGEADKEHSNAFLKALEAEVTMGYSNTSQFIAQASARAIALISKIYA